MSNDKYVILMPGGAMQHPALEYIKQCDFKVIIFDGSERAILREQADVFIKIDIFDQKKCLNALIDLSRKYNIVTTVTLSADCHATVALMAQFLNAPLTWSSAISEICLDKFKTRQFLREICYQPDICEINSFTDISKVASALVSSPVVLKAPDSSGSRGFQAFDNILHITEDDFDYTKGFSKSGKVIIESKLQRTKKFISELSVEALWLDGDCKILNVVDRVFTDDARQYGVLDYFTRDLKNSGIEVGHFNPSFLPASKLAEIKAIYKKIFDKLPAEGGLLSLKLDLMIDEYERLVVLEMTPRLSGGWDSCYSNIAIGGNVQRIFLDYCLGRISEVAAYDNALEVSQLCSRIFVLGIPEFDASDCIGRLFYTSDVLGLDVPAGVIIASAVNQCKRGETLETLSIC